MFIPEDLMKGPLHSVGEQAENDGLLNTYFLYSGDNGIRGDDRHRFAHADSRNLRDRQVGGDEQDGRIHQSVGNAGKQKIDSVVGLVKDPVGTIKRVPQGASRFFGRIGESLKGGESEGEGNALESITGVEKPKVALAAKLGVSPYSTNQELQEQLTNTARAMAGGGLVISAALMPIGGGLGALSRSQCESDPASDAR